MFSSSFSALAVECVYVCHAAALANIAPDADADAALAGYPTALSAGHDGNEAAAPLIWPRLLEGLCARTRAIAMVGAASVDHEQRDLPRPSRMDMGEGSDFVSIHGGRARRSEHPFSPPLRPRFPCILSV